jgi:hypothetical protein
VPERGDADWQDLVDDSAFNLADFDLYIEEHGIPEEEYPPRSRCGSPSGRAGRCLISRNQRGDQ